MKKIILGVLCGTLACLIHAQIVDFDGGVAPDQVINDDLIVTSSACIGFDCVNGESFGFDTLVLKENNLRVFFNDTSATASFPAVDWRITVNDSDNGGENRFSIDDSSHSKTPFSIRGNAPTHSLYIAKTGYVGFGTSTPSAELHSVDGDTPTLRLQQDGSSGWQAQSWDVAGNETNFFIRDVTNGSQLPFRIAPGAPTSSLTINADGNVGVGTWSPDEPLVLSADGAARFALVNTTVTDSATMNQKWLFNSNGTLRISAGSDAPELILDASGNLELEGTLTANAGDAFPDYVFESDYNLMTLSELNSFISENGHLPNVPSANDVRNAGGHNMTQLQLTLLEKVEELTLYTLQQEETIRDQGSRIRALEEKIEFLMSKLSEL